MKPISCKEAVQLILKKEEKKLSLVQHISLWRHLATCSLCRIFSKQNSLMNEAMKHRQDHLQQTLSSDEKETIIQNVLHEKKL